MTNTSAVSLGLFLLVFIVLAVVFGPLAILWALNTLFPVLAIPYTFWNWLAVVVLNLTWMYKPAVKTS